MAIFKKELKIEHSLCTILHVLCVTLLEKAPSSQAFSDPSYTINIDAFANQLSLFD